MIANFICGLIGLMCVSPNLGVSTFIVQQGGTGKTTFTSSQVIYGNGTNALSSVATTSLTINAPLTTSGTPGALVGGSNLTIDIDDIKAADLDLTDITLNDFTNDAGFLTTLSASAPIRLIGSTLDFTGLATTSQPSSSNLLTSNGGSGVYGTATTSYAVSGFPANLSGTLGAFVGGANSTWTYWGLATTSQPSQSNLLYSTGAAGVAGVATTSVTCTGTVSCSTFNVLGASPITITGSAGGFDYPFPSAATSTMLTFTGGILVNNSTSTITNLTTVNATSTNATTTNMSISGTLDVDGLTSALVLTGATGIFAEYTGVSCTNQVVEDLSALGAGTCVSINNGYWSGTDLSVANGGTGLSTFGGSNTVLYTTAADTLSSEAAFTYTAGTDNLAFTFGSSTSLTSSGGSWLAATAGNVGIGTTTPWGKFSINPVVGDGAAPRFVVGSSTNTSLILNRFGNFGFGSTTPWGNFAIEADTVDPSFVVSDSAATVPYLFVQSASNNGKVGVGTTTPWANFSLNPTAVLNNAPAFSIGSSSKTYVHTTSGGQTSACETDVGTASSTAYALNWRDTCNTVLYRHGLSATTFSIIRATTTDMAGSRKMLIVCNPTGTAGAITFRGIEWAGGTVPTQTTTTNQCDVYSLFVTQATSTASAPTYKVFGAQNAGFQ